MSFPILILIGLVLGQSQVGWRGTPTIAILSQIGAIGFLFISGIECQLLERKTKWAKVLVISFFSFSVPFFLGFFFASIFGIRDLTSQLIIGSAFSVSALPIVIQILKENGLFGSAISKIIILSASICDILVWILFFSLLPPNHQQNWLSSHSAVLLFFVAVFLRLAIKIPLSTVEKLKGLNAYVFAPMFFICVGVNLNLWDSLNWGLVIAAFGVASFAKISATYFAAKFQGFSSQDCWLVAFSLNARGAMEILLAELAFKANLIDRNWYATLIVISILTSVMAGPLLKLVSRQGSRASLRN